MIVENLQTMKKITVFVFHLNLRYSKMYVDKRYPMKISFYHMKGFMKR